MWILRNCIFLIAWFTLAWLAYKAMTLSVEASRPEKIEETPTIYVKYLRHISPIVVSPKGDWIDLRAGKDVYLMKDEYACIPLGVAMKLPDGYSAIIAPRSSTFQNWKIIQTNSIGVIDNVFCGENDEWMLPVLAHDETLIKQNERICQFRLLKNEPDPDIIRVDKLNYEDRGGLDSTGKE